MPTSKSDIKRALKWSFLAELTAKTLQPLIFIVLARLLTPDDFGVMAAAVMTTAFSQVLWEAGMGKALIQRQGKIEAAANAAFWINLGLGAVVAAGLLLAAPPIAQQIFHDERVATVLFAMTPVILLGALGSIPAALLQREMEFRQLFWIRFATVGLPGLASIPLALSGMGYWALVWGSLIGQLAQTLLLWWQCRWRPSKSFDRPVGIELARFGSWVALSGIFAWFYIWMDTLVVGHFLGSHDMGIYRVGNMAAMMVFGVLLSPLLPVLYSTLARMQETGSRIGELLPRIARAMMLVAAPVAGATVFLQAPIEIFIFGANWAGIGNAIALLVLAHAMAWLVGANGEAYRALGKPQLETWAMAITLPVYLAGYLLAAAISLEAVLYMRCGLVVFGVLTQIAIARIGLGIPFEGWAKPFRVMILPLAAASLLLLSPAETQSISTAILFASIYLLYLAFFERKFIQSLMISIRQAHRPNAAPTP